MGAVCNKADAVEPIAHAPSNNRVDMSVVPVSQRVTAVETGQYMKSMRTTELSKLWRPEQVQAQTHEQEPASSTVSSAVRRDTTASTMSPPESQISDGMEDIKRHSLADESFPNRAHRATLREVWWAQRIPAWYTAGLTGLDSADLSVCKNVITEVTLGKSELFQEVLTHLPHRIPSTFFFDNFWARMAILHIHAPAFARLNLSDKAAFLRAVLSCCFMLSTPGNGKQKPEDVVSERLKSWQNSSLNFQTVVHSFSALYGALFSCVSDTKDHTRKLAISRVMSYVLDQARAVLPFRPSRPVPSQLLHSSGPIRVPKGSGLASMAHLDADHQFETELLYAMNRQLVHTDSPNFFVLNACICALNDTTVTHFLHEQHQLKDAGCSEEVQRQFRESYETFQRECLEPATEAWSHVYDQYVCLRRVFDQMPVPPSRPRQHKGTERQTAPLPTRNTTRALVQNDGTRDIDRSVSQNRMEMLRSPPSPSSESKLPQPLTPRSTAQCALPPLPSAVVTEPASTQMPHSAVSEEDIAKEAAAHSAAQNLQSFRESYDALNLPALWLRVKRWLECHLDAYDEQCALLHAGVHSSCDGHPLSPASPRP